MHIEQKENWIGKTIESLPNEELASIIKEIADCRGTGCLKTERLADIEKKFSKEVAHTRPGENMRLIEDAVLFEAARRFYNNLVDLEG